MKTCALAIGILALGGSLASAGTYVGLGVGSGIDTNGDGSYSSSDRTGKLLVGYSFGQIAIEAAGQRGSLVDANAAGFDLTQLSVAGKYNLPLADGFEAFGRVGYQRTSLSSQTGATPDTAGTGLLIGAGIEYKLNLVATSASIFLDYNFATTSLEGGNLTAPQKLETRGFLLGATIGF